MCSSNKRIQTPTGTQVLAFVRYGDYYAKRNHIVFCLIPRPNHIDADGKVSHFREGTMLRELWDRLPDVSKGRA